MKMLLVGAGGVGESIVKILQKRDPEGNWLKKVVISDYDIERAREVVEHLGDKERFIPEKVNAKYMDDIVDLIDQYECDFVMDAAAPFVTNNIFDAAYAAGASCANMGTWSVPYAKPHYGYGLENSFREIMANYNFDHHDRWRDKGILGLICLGIDPGVVNVFAKFAALHLFDEIHEVHVKDGGTTMLLDIFEKLDRRMVRGNRNTFAHLMLIKDRDIKRMGELGIIASAQPWWFTYDSWVPGYYCVLFGPERTDTLYPMKSFLDAGVVVASGSDFPVTIPADPMHGIQLGMTRTVTEDLADYQIESYRRPLGPDADQTKECVTLKDMVQSFTINVAYENFLENITGSIEQGKSADLVVVDQNLTEIEPANIKNTKVLLTFFKGKLVYQA